MHCMQPSTGGQPHREVAGEDDWRHEAGQGLVQLPHGRVPNDDDALAGQAGLKLLSAEGAQLAHVRLVRLPVDLQHHAAQWACAL